MKISKHFKCGGVVAFYVNLK